MFSEVEKHPLSLKKKTEGKIGSNVSTVAWNRPVSAGESQGPQPSQVFFESQQRYRGVLQRTVCMYMCVYVCVCVCVCPSNRTLIDVHLVSTRSPFCLKSSAIADNKALAERPPPFTSQQNDRLDA